MDLQEIIAPAPFSFGQIDLVTDEEALFASLNVVPFALCKRLPSPLQNDAILFFMTYAKNRENPFAFFRNFPAPLWTLLHWMEELAPDGYLNEEVRDTTITGHAMSLLLHSLDDHMNDGQLRASHLLLQIRTQAWRLFEESALHMGRDTKTARNLFDASVERYFRGIHNPPPAANIDGYLETFRMQCATWTVIPSLLAHRLRETGGATRPLALSPEMAQSIIESFSIAFRIQDDLEDMAKDALAHENTAVRLALPEDLRYLWDSATEESLPELLQAIEESGTIPLLSQRIMDAMDRAMLLAREAGMEGYEKELAAVAGPFRELLAHRQ